MRLILIHARVMTVELARYPAFLIPTLVFPAVFFLFFVTPGPKQDATVRMATFAGFAVIGIAFFQFGVGIAGERGSPWERYLRTLPVGPLVRLGARILSAAVFACAAAGLLVVTAVVATGASLAAERWAQLAFVLLAGTIPFAFLGIALGYWAPSRGALPVANLLYLGLSYAGGLWSRPGALPHVVRVVSPYLPTRALSDALVSVATGASPAWSAWAVLATFACIFATLATVGYRRDEERRFS
ncbi:MAG TPA: ABC transporter permease [Gaiellaceae bacterium]|nr:ABC transporter permease [Gaiellaceae bacterium]